MLGLNPDRGIKIVYTQHSSLRRLTIVLLFVCLSTPALANNDDGVLVLGRVSNDPCEHYDRLRPLLDYVVENMADIGIREGRILMARDGQAMISFLRQGRVDWVTETAGAAIMMMNRGEAQPLLRGWRGGRSQYQSLFVVRQDSGINTLDQLRGRSVGFQHPLSTSGYMVPAGMLLEAGLNVTILLSPLDQPSQDFVGYAFTGQALNSITWVHKQIVDVAAISDQDWEEYVESVPEYRRDLRVLERSPAIPRAMELVRKDLDPSIRIRLRQILLNAEQDPSATAALDAYFRTIRFTPADALMLEQIEPLRRMSRRVREELE
ncbi:MAG: phosphate/phosphite/phosphonate ABC transporter substrate-binding protein [Pseudomonadota bacterium]